MARMSSTRKPFERVFKWKVNKETGCWNCTSHTSTSNGYVKITYGKECTTGHRVSYQIHKGEIPNGMVVRHTCDNKQCINPDHLIIGTQKQNIQDMKKRKRHLYGERHPLSKLTKEDVAFILKNPEIRNADMARKLNVDPVIISHVRKGRSWVEVTEQLGLSHLVNRSGNLT